MKSKNKIVTIGIILTTLILAGIAIFTAIRLYQTRTEPVAPNVPESKPKAAVSTCSLNFTIVVGGTPTPTATATATPAPGCNSACSILNGNSDCPSGLICQKNIDSSGQDGFCRKAACPNKINCICSATPTATPAPGCNSACSILNGNSDCPSGLICQKNIDSSGTDGFCRKATCPNKINCICSATPTATATATGRATATGSGRPTGTSTPTTTSTATATANPQCNNSCTQNTDCPDGLMCNIPSGATTGSCRNTSCLSETDCLCPQPTSTATSTSIAEQPELPSVGTTWPTIVGTAFGILVILGSLLLAF